MEGEGRRRMGVMMSHGIPRKEEQGVWEPWNPMEGAGTFCTALSRIL
jgi:hypothetical protein